MRETRTQPTSERDPVHGRAGRVRTALVLASLVAIVALLTVVWRAASQSLLPAARAPGEAPAETEAVLGRPGALAPAEARRALAPNAAAPDAAEDAPPAPAASAAAPERGDVTLHGAALVIDADGRESAGADGTLALGVRVGSGGELRRAEVLAGRFSIEVPADALLRVHELVLDGEALRVEDRDHRVPDDRFLVLRGQPLLAVTLHVRAADDGRELTGVEVREAGRFVFQDAVQHPGEDPIGPPLVADGRSPLAISPPPGAGDGTIAYFVRAAGYAWGAIALDHGARGERDLVLQRAGELLVELSGSAPWLAPRVRLWRPDVGDPGPYASAERAPDAHDRALFTSLAEGDWLVTVDRGWADDRLVFASATATVVAGERTHLPLSVSLPERPVAAVVAGVLVLPRAWSRDGVGLRFVPQGAASVWVEGELELPFAALAPVSAASPGPPAADADGDERLAWELELPVAGAYELAVDPFYVRMLLDVPAGGRSGVEVVVPPPADVELSFVDEATGERLAVESAHYSPPHVEGILATRLLPATYDPARGCIAFRAPAGPTDVSPTEPSISLVERGPFELAPGRNVLALAVTRRFGIRVVFLDGDATLPWNWDWQVGTRPAGSEGREVSRGLGTFWFTAPGAYELAADPGIPGYAPIDGTRIDVPPAPFGAPLAVVEVPLRRLP